VKHKGAISSEVAPFSVFPSFRDALLGAGPESILLIVVVNLECRWFRDYHMTGGSE